MSLYEASAHLFYGVQIQRMGRDADDTLPLGEEPYDDAKSALKALGLWTEPPDWYPAFKAFQKTNPQYSYLSDLRAQDPDHACVKLYEEHKAAIRAQTLGCELDTMGAGESDDQVIYVLIEDSHFRCSSEDDHGGFGEDVIPGDKLVYHEGWNESLAKFCALIGVPAELVKPRWTLTMRG